MAIPVSTSLEELLMDRVTGIEVKQILCRTIQGTARSSNEEDYRYHDRVHWHEAERLHGASVEESSGPDSYAGAA